MGFVCCAQDGHDGKHAITSGAQNRFGYVVVHEWASPRARQGRVSPENELALAYLAHRAHYYAREGETYCGTCGMQPEASTTFSENMPCGHPWGGLMWRRPTSATPVEPGKTPT